MKNLTAEEEYEIVKDGIRTYEEAFSADQDERRLALDDIIFAYSEDGQWDSLAKKRRRRKPRYTINKIAPAINEIYGKYLQNRIELKARPFNDADQDEVFTYNGLIRAITSTRESTLAKNIAFKGITASGYGAMRVSVRNVDQNPFDQEVCLEPIYEPLERIWFDPFAKDMTAKDGRYVHDVQEMDRDEFERMYPEATLKTFPEQDLAKLQNQRWGVSRNRKNTILVSDFYRREYDEVEMVQLSDGSVMESEAFETVRDELLDQRIEEVARANQDRYKIMCYRMSGCQILEEPKEVPGQFLPIIRVLGFYEWQSGVLHYRGIVRAAKDPQRVYNYTTSENVSSVALAPKDKVLATAKMIAGHANDWNQINNDEKVVMQYDPDPEAPGGAPVPFNISQPQPALVQQAQQAELDLQSTIGRRAPAQGDMREDRSGKAIFALQAQDDAVTYELNSNLASAVEHASEVVIGMIPFVYSDERQVQILGDDDEESVVTVNSTIVDNETGNRVTKNDMNRRYRVKATVGPAFETKRTEMVNVLSTLSQDDQYKPLVADLLAKSMDFPFAPELSRRMRKIQLAQGLVEPTEEERKELAEQQAAQAQDPNFQLQQQVQQRQLEIQLAMQEQQLLNIQLQNQNLAANIENIQAGTARKFEEAKGENVDIEKTRTENYTNMIDSMIKKVEAGGVITPDETQTLNNMLSLIDAGMREDFDNRLQAEIQKRQLRQSQPLV